jgi:FAD/FMN-containing dehydrogenase/Fe-S oxidoreductase
MTIRRAGPAFWDRLAHEIEGDAACDLFTRGRYSTDASIYQCFPAGVVCPKSAADIAIVLEMAREEGLSVTARGGGTSTAGQALGEGIIVDFSKYLNRIVQIDAGNLRCVAEPGCSPAAINAAARPHRLSFPVDIGSARQASIGGMLGNNASGIRALRYGSMRDNVASADGFLADGQQVQFNEVSETGGAKAPAGRDRLLDLLQFGELHEKAIATLWPLRAPGTPEPEGYDLRTLLASSEDQNLARILAGAEGTLAVASRIELKLAPRPVNRALGVCRFASLTDALRAVPKIMLLNPSAVELLDRTLIEVLTTRARQDAQAGRIVQGEPEALLLVEFDEENAVANTRLLKSLDEYVSEGSKARAGIVEILGEKARAGLWRLRREALTRAWSLKSAAQPVALIEDGAVPLQNLAAYGAGLEALFEKHGVRSAIYGQAGRGSLHVRPVLNLRYTSDRKRMRQLGDEMAELISTHCGVLTGSHGIGLARSEALERKLGPEAAGLFAQLKAQLDPGFLLNPGKLLRPPRFDELSLLRAPHEARASAGIPISLAWGPPASPARALEHVRRCNGLALCRTAEPRFACPSFAVTRDERDSPRGRANSVRLALSGQLGDAALGSAEMMETMRLCVSCKACKTACPLGIDIPKMKIEALAAARTAGRNERAADLLARLPAYTDRARRWRALLALRDLLPGAPRFTERRYGLAADRPWPRWAGRRFRAPRAAPPGPLGTVALFADTFNRSFEPVNLRAAASVLEAAGYAVIAFADEDHDSPPPCCGRTYYDAGYAAEARREAARTSAAAQSFKEKGIPVVGLEPACVLMMRSDYAGLGFSVKEKPAVLLFEEFAADRLAEGKFAPPLKSIEADVILHSHCHERAEGLEHAALEVLKLVPKLAAGTAPPACCGLNGATGMTPETFEASLAMAELQLFPAIRKAGRDAFVAATGFSCRKQIYDGLGRTARHPAAILELALKGDAEIVG